MLNLAYNSVRQRTAESLLKMSHSLDSTNEISISRDDLAKIAGTASESVTRVLSDFKDEGLIEIENSKIKVKQRGKLEKINLFKLLFIFSRRQEKPQYDFIPYKF